MAKITISPINTRAAVLFFNPFIMKENPINYILFFSYAESITKICIPIWRDI